MPTSTEDKIFQFLANNPNKQGLEELSWELGLDQRSLDEELEKHFYLAPNNLLRAQRHLGLLAIVLAIALTILQIDTEVTAVSLAALVGLILSTPYFAVYLGLRFGKVSSKVRIVYMFSFFYTVFLSIVFVVFAVLLRLYLAGLIPVVVSLLYFLELQKLNKLIKKLDETRS